MADDMCMSILETPVSIPRTEAAIVTLWDRAVRARAVAHQRPSDEHSKGRYDAYLQALGLLLDLPVRTIRLAIEQEVG